MYLLKPILIFIVVLVVFLSMVAIDDKISKSKNEKFKNKYEKFKHAIYIILFFIVVAFYIMYLFQA